MNYTLRHLRYFVTASEHGSISQAARSLNVSQPSVSAAVGHLESIYGIALFLRNHSHGVSLTPAGRDLLREARLLLGHAADFDAVASNVAHSISGEIRVSSFVNIASFYMAGIIRSFTEKYPNTSVRTIIGNQAEVLDSIRTGYAEVAVTFDLGLSTDLQIDVIRQLRPKLVVPEKHRIAKQESASLEDMIDEPYICLDLPISRDYFFSLFERHGIRPAQVIPVASYETIRTFVGNGLGYSLLNLQPKNSVNYDGSRVRYLYLDGDHRELKVCCLSVKDAIRRRIAVAFIDHVRDFFTELQS